MTNIQNSLEGWRLKKELSRKVEQNVKKKKKRKGKTVRGPIHEV